LQNAGTRPTYPIIDFYGPMGDGADPTYFEYTLTVVHPVWHVYGGRIQFLPTFIIPADEFVRVDTRDRTVLLNGNVNILGKLDLANTVWAPLLPAANYVNPAEIEYECSLVCANPAVGAVDYFPGLKPQPGEYSGNIEMITPVSGPSIGGTVVDVWGGPFGQGGMSGVTFTFAKNPGSMGGPGTVSFTKISDAHVQVVAPPVDQISTTGPGGYYLTCWRQQPGDVAGYAAYTYLPTTITGISPGSGPITGGTGVSISASFGMSNATGVLFGTVPGVGFYIVSDTEIYVETPVGAAAIPVDVTVQKSDGDVIIPNGFVYLNPPPEAGEQQSHVVVIWNDAYLL
jgi:hypothetical protein